MEKNTNNIIAACQHDFEETPKDKNDFVSAEYCEDGTIIRLYNYNNMWVTATKNALMPSLVFGQIQKHLMICFGKYLVITIWIYQH